MQKSRSVATITDTESGIRISYTTALPPRLAL